MNAGGVREIIARLTLVLCVLNTFAFSILRPPFVLGNKENEFLNNEMKRALDEENEHEQASCASTRRVKRHDHARFPLSPPSGTKFGKALQFTGREAVRFKDVRIPSTFHQFTVDFWVKPEGGQYSPVTILGLFDNCSPPDVRDSGWKIGLADESTQKVEENRARNLRVFFSLRTQRANFSTTIFSLSKVQANVWIHVAANYDGRKMRLFINQAQEAASSEQKGRIFGYPHGGNIDKNVYAPDLCETLEGGGDRFTNIFFRGTLDELRLWGVAKPHKNITDNAFVLIKQKDKSVLFYEGFSSPLRRWVPITETVAEIVKSTVPSEAHDLSIHKPPCGNTVCDNPEVVKSYLVNRELSGHKILRYRVVNVMQDDGSDPIVTREQIQRQHQILREAFSAYNITWLLNIVEIKNSSLRYRTTLYLCEASMVGDRRCNEECNFAITGNDGGDCDGRKQLRCNEKRHHNNGKCDPECNGCYTKWDSGECCDPRITDTHKTCFDPKSPHRAYISVREYKSIINLENREFLNVYFARWTKRTIQGIATFPWDKSAHSIEGGIVLHPKNYGASHAIVHEFGHALGLLHVHHGVSEMKCTDECYESFPSLELGDLCSDTNPTPANEVCGNPKVKKSETYCGVRHFKETPYKNFMSYSDDKCTESFTPQQSARMHCYVDLVHQSWQPVATTPSFIPLPPRIISEDPQGVTLSWIPPLGTGGGNAINKCHECWENSIFQQYAVTAWSPNPAKPSRNWAPHQATGAQDAQPCSASPKAWLLPETGSYSDCYIELGFKKAVVPTRLSIWVPWHPKDGIRDIRLLFTDKTETSLGNATAQCDEPLTIPIKTNKKVMSVRIHLRNTLVSIDAVRLTSSVNHPNCRKCRDVYYKVSRVPPFPASKSLVEGRAVVKTSNFKDRDIKQGVTYRYHVQAVISSSVKGAGAPSPPLFYTPKRGFCGDGKVDEKNGEQCDDGNVRDGDGCNVRCKKEDVFHCKGHPSLCYRHDGDGICEEFEKTTSIKDCGFYTPEGFADQWAVTSLANRKYKKRECSVDVVNGPPPRDLVCKPKPDPGTAWSPCDYGRNNWLEVSFKTPVVASAVVLYLASDGREQYDMETKTVRLEVADDHNQYFSNGGEVALSCKTNPVTIPVHHDMSKPFFYTQKIRISFKSDAIAIAGVALRHSKILNPVALQNCKPGQMFNPLTQQCHDYPCTVPSCKELELEHADITCQGRKEGQVCRVTCKRGYRPVEQFQMTCLGGRWVDRVTHFKGCAPANCGKPKIRNGEVECRKGTTLGKKCTFTCKPNAKMISGNNVIKCEEDARWSTPAAHCTMTCPEPAIPRYSKQIGKQCIGNKARGVEPFTPGMTCKFRCQEGYRTVHKEKYSKRVIRLRCKKSGRWSGGECELITCKKPSPYILAYYNCTNKNNFGSTCTFGCPGEKHEVITCSHEGLWDGTFRKCPTAGHCDRPKNIAGFTFICGNLEPGSKCKAKCSKKGFEAAIRGLEGKWIVSTTCTVRLKWFPDPSKFYCLPRCNHKKLGDGYCDRANNNKHCRYDRGDCCKSTVKERQVMPSPPDCDILTDCKCKDPQAVENRNDRPVPDDEDEDSGSGRNYMTTESNDRIEIEKKKI